MVKINFISHNIDFSLKKKAIHRKRILYIFQQELQVLQKEASRHKRGTLRSGFVNYIFCDDNYLLSLNKTHLKHNTLTDILTFDYSAVKEGRFPFLPSEKQQIEAEIFISIPRVIENAGKFGSSFEQELSRVMIHGILHLCGYRDRTSEQKKLMRQKEDLYLPGHSAEK